MADDKDDEIAKLRELVQGLLARVMALESQQKPDDGTGTVPESGLPPESLPFIGLGYGSEAADDRVYPAVAFYRVTAQPDSSAPVYTVAEYCSESGSLVVFSSGRTFTAKEVNGNNSVPVGTYVVGVECEDQAQFDLYFEYNMGTGSTTPPTPPLKSGFYGYRPYGRSEHGPYTPTTWICFGYDDASSNEALTNRPGAVSWDHCFVPGDTLPNGTTVPAGKFYAVGSVWTLLVDGTDAYGSGVNSRPVTHLNFPTPALDAYGGGEVGFALEEVLPTVGTDSYTLGRTVKVKGRTVLPMITGTTNGGTGTNAKQLLFTDGSRIDY